jgi:hypothetical protein
MMSEGDTIWDKMGSMDYRYVYALTIILILIPVIRPLGIPMMTTKTVQDYYDAIDNLPAGSVVAVSMGGGMGTLDELEAAFLATWKVLFQRDLKVLFYCTTTDGPIILDYHFGEKAKPEDYGKVYGEDYVRLGYNPLGEPGEASFALSIRSVYSADYKGTPLNQITMMQDIDSHRDIDLLIYIHTACTSVEIPVRQWIVPFNQPTLTITLGCCGPMTSPYYPAQIQGFLSGSGPGAELEIIGRVPGPGALINDAKNLGIIGLLVFLVLGNASYWGKRLTGG